jgi:hypothetical protein
MKKEQVRKISVIFVVVLLAASAIGYVFFPSAMLSVVGIESNAQIEFLVRALAAALTAMIPSVWGVRNKENPSLYKNVMVGIAIYMFFSSAVDLHAYLTHLVNSASIPSIFFRVALSGLFLWLARQE